MIISHDAKAENTYAFKVSIAITLVGTIATKLILRTEREPFNSITRTTKSRATELKLTKSVSARTFYHGLEKEETYPMTSRAVSGVTLNIELVAIIPWGLNMIPSPKKKMGTV